MSLVLELITSVLVQAPIVASFHGDDPDGKVHRQNALLIALDPAAFGDPDAFPAAVADTLDTVKGLPRADEDEDAQIAYPGERSAATAAARSADGVPVGPKVWDEIVSAAERLGVRLPDVAGA